MNVHMVKLAMNSSPISPSFGPLGPVLGRLPMLMADGQLDRNLLWAPLKLKQQTSLLMHPHRHRAGIATILCSIGRLLASLFGTYACPQKGFWLGLDLPPPLVDLNWMDALLLGYLVDGLHPTKSLQPHFGLEVRQMNSSLF